MRSWCVRRTLPPGVPHRVRRPGPAATGSRTISAPLQNRETSMFNCRLLQAAALITGFGLTTDAPAASFRLTSPDFKPGGTLASEQVFDSFGCTGQNVSPALEWSGAPKDTKSFALLMHDPDAPTGGAGWWHWLVYNIPAG